MKISSFLYFAIWDVKTIFFRKGYNICCKQCAKVADIGMLS